MANGVLEAGQDFALLEPITYYAPLGTPLPPADQPYNVPWASPWTKIMDTVQGLQVSCRNPRTAIVSEERGRIGDVAGGDEGVSVAFQLLTMKHELMTLISGMTSSLQVSQPESAAGAGDAVPEVQASYIDKRQRNHFMLGFEGYAVGGSLWDEDRVFRGIVYRGSQTANAEHVWRHVGADALFRPSVTLEALPTRVDPTQYTAAKYSDALIDPHGRFNYFATPA